MRYGNRVLLLILLVGLVSSCGPVTPVVLTRTPSVSLSPNEQSVIPGSPSSIIATSTPTETPQPSAWDYQLRPWIADDAYYSKLIERFGSGVYVGINTDSHRYALAFEAENLLRTHSDKWRDTAWRIVADYPKGISLAGMRPNEDLLAFLIEDLFNNQGIGPDELPAYLKKQGLDSTDCYRSEVVESPSKQDGYLVVNNLFGDEQDAWLFYAGNCRSTAIYALRRENNQYWVEKLRDWQELEIVAAGFALLLDTVGDLNNNGVPEVLVTELFGASGTPPGRRETIEFYEWDESKRAFASDKVIIREDVCYLYQPCDNGWRVETVNAQGFRPVVVNELYATMLQEVEGESVCEALIIEHVYLWKNAKFVEQKKTLLPPTDERIECQLSWALQALNRNNNLSDAASEIISKSLENWADTMIDMWGPASRDYFALRLGLSYDMTGREEDALSLIQNVAEHPFDPDYPFASQLAASYLDIRLKQGKVNACKEISLLQGESEHENFPPYAIYVSLASLREVWGVGAPIWMDGVDAVCDERLALQAVAQQASKYMTVDEFFTNAGLNPISVHTVYEADTLTAWLVSLPTQFLSLSKDGDSFERINYQRLWLFTRSAQGFRVAYIDDADLDANLSTDSLHLGQDGSLVVIQAYELNFQRFFIFRIASTGEIQNQLYDFYVDGFVTAETSEITTIAGSYSLGHPEIAVYKWNSEGDRLDKKITNFDFPRAQDEAERLMFQEQDFAQSILYINEFLIQAPPEPKVETSCINGRCDYYPEWYRPYMRYLLALAYEMSGRVEQARDTYFLLWKDYPENFFGLAAEHRLNPSEP